jgi:CRISPR-associated protein Csx10
MTRCIVLEMTPNSAAIFSRDASTEGAHATLNAPTGAALLGWAAQHCYDEFTPDVAFKIFHSGQVRFSDAVRMVDDEPSFLNPATLFEPKHGTGTHALGRSAFETANDKGVQAEAVKRKWVTLGGAQAPDPRLQHRLRTAMSGGVAEEGKLFGYAAVLAGQTKYRATIECDAEVADGDWGRIKAAFNGATLRIGRASSSGYGGSLACCVDQVASPWTKAEATAIDCPQGGTVSFWLLSDAQLTDEWGNPKVDPMPADFGLDTDWDLYKPETAISARRVWPWNRKYNSRDMEISVIEAGSVISFKRLKGEGPVSCKPRIGIGQERGFGRIAVLGEFTYGQSCGTDAATPPVAGESDLTKWAAKRAESSRIETRSTWADEQIEAAKGMIRSMNGEHPSATQWGHLRDVIDHFQAVGFDAKLVDVLKNSSWSANYIGLGDWVQSTLFARPEQSTAEQRAHEIRRVVKVAGAYKPEGRA